MRKIFVMGSFSALLLTLASCQQHETYYFSEPDVVDETYVHRYGVPVSPEEWSEGGNHGQIRSTLANGVVVSKSYNSGVLEGDTTYSYPHSSMVEKVESYRNGVLQKACTQYISGAPKEETTYVTPQHRSITTWYESGAAKSKEEFQGKLLYQGSYYGQNNEIESQVTNYNGKRIKRDDYGQVESHDDVVNGQMVQKTHYHPNGAPKAVMPYRDDNIHGQVRTYLPAGEPLTVEEWKDGARSGLSTEYNNGEKVLESNYVAGVKDGTEYRYRDGNAVVQETTWAKGVKHGPSTTAVGNTTKTDWYYQDKPVSKSNFDMMTGPAAKKNIWR